MCCLCVRGYNLVCYTLLMFYAMTVFWLLSEALKTGYVGTWGGIMLLMNIPVIIVMTLYCCCSSSSSGNTTIRTTTIVKYKERPPEKSF